MQTKIRKKSRLLLAVTFLAFSSVATNGHADIILTTGLSGGSGDVQNVLFGAFSGQQGTTVSGTLNQSGEQVDFTGNEVFITPANGQARIEALDGSFDFISIMLNDATLGFDKIQFNIDAAANGNAVISMYDQFGTAFVFANQALSANGQNFFTGQGIHGQVIVRATISTNVAMIGINDLQQVRLGPKVVPPAQVPEPGMLALIGLGLGVMGFGNLRRKRLAA